MNAETHAQFLAPNARLRDVGAPHLDLARGLDALRRIDVPLALACVVVAAILACAALPGWIAPFTTTDMDHDAILQAPGAIHMLGTDHLGRDVLSLLIYGARQSVQVALGAVLFGTLVGGFVGLVAGYVGKTLDMVLMRIIDIWMAIPSVLLVIMIATALSASLWNISLTIGFVATPRIARVMRAQVIAIKQQPYIEASRSIGATHKHILLRHILPHTLSQMLVMMTMGIATAMLMGAMLSFIGLGVIDDTPDWGYLLSQGRSYLTVAWWFGTFPGLAITAIVISVNLIGEALRHRLDPRARAR
jgi:peptide/nickel transport system permease protein